MLDTVTVRDRSGRSGIYRSPVPRLAALIAATATTALGMVVLPGTALAATPSMIQTIVVTPASGLLNPVDTRATGHSEFLLDGLRVWTEGATGTDKADGYIAQAQSLGSLVSQGEPSWVWTADPSLTPEPGKQLVVDFDDDGSPDGTLVGEPVYGNVWWLTNGSASFVKLGAPNHGGGQGSDNWGTLAEWSVAFPTAQVAAVGYSLGSGVHGDGVLSSMTFGETTYTFTAALDPCVVAIDDVTQTYTLTQDCTTSETIHVPDGWTVDGNGFTITAVEDAEQPNFPGPIMVSATGTDGAPASLDVKNLTITTQFSGANSNGLLAGIKFDRAGGSVTNTTINGVTHGNGVQEGIALYVRNRTAAGAFVSDEVTVNVDNVTVTRYQKSGVIIDGNVGFAMTDSVVGRSSDAAGNPIPGIAANSVQLSRGAHGALTGNTIALNDYNPSPPPGDGSDATGILIYDSGSITASQNIVSGTNGDVGLDMYNDGVGSFSTSVTASCNLFQRAEVDGDYDPYGIGIAQWDDGSVPVPLSLSDTTFIGWKYGTGTIMSDLSVEPGAPGQTLGACLPSTPVVTVTGGESATDVSWTASTAPAYAPLSGYVVTLTGDDSSTQMQQVAVGTTTTQFSGLTEGVTYVADVAAVNASGSAVGSATLYPTILTISPDQGTITFKKTANLLGALSSGDPDANLADRTVVIEAQPVGEVAWTPLGTATTDSNGEFSYLVKPTKNTAYRAHYAGNPDLSTTSNTASVYVAPKITMTISDDSVALGTIVQFSGHAKPNQRHRPVILQRLVAGNWTTVMTDTVGAHSRYSFFWQSDVVGTSSWRVTIPPSANYAIGHSKKADVTVT